MYKIGVDAMGGDLGIEATVKACMDAVAKYNDIEIYLYGNEEQINKKLTNPKNIKVVHTTDILDMGEKDPIKAVKDKRKTASLCVAMNDAKNKVTDCVITAGPTQCVVVASHLLIRRLPMVDRIALCPIIPNLDNRPRLLLDVGANVELRPNHINLLATFSSVVAKAILGYENPKVGLLNIGSEPGKGREVDKETFYMLQSNPNIKFYGNVEPNEVLNCPSEIIITDGFTGNICMKTIEGTAKNVSKMLKEEIKSSFTGKLGYLFMRKNLKRFAKRMDSKEIGGAMILGLGTPVIKAHGNSDSYAFFHAIRQGRDMVKNQVINKILETIERDKESGLA